MSSLGLSRETVFCRSTAGGSVLWMCAAGVEKEFMLCDTRGLGGVTAVPSDEGDTVVADLGDIMFILLS